ncbi:type II secretion system F family protein [Lederbergia sp. NSJ-179]|uniref:competence type IV pilus assembly protein ComGB n=1 Tax=Lederbergia sp. NSJ-179 TaxID=2931402 RepID=UPI001FD03925|nr:competence type IV pilus assembly protein ComGB [Lederbergia sp. NSJ-179]MCJ7839314.1 type II secretion system F family protein [Lederbergia sp. NSJ-179]
MTLKDQGQFFIRGSDMLENGYTFVEVFQFFMNIQAKHHALFSSMMTELENGSSIHEVFIKHDFDNQACAMVYFAEKHGFLAKTFRESGNYLLQKEQQRKKFVKLMQYPFILLFALVFVALILKTVLLPQFQLLYHTIGFQPNGMTQFILHLIDHLPTYFAISLCFFLLAAFLIKRYFRKKSAFETATILSSIPLYQYFYRLYQTIFFAREWSLLLQNGFSLNEIVKIMESQNFRPLLQETGKYLKKELVMGSSFSRTLTQLHFIAEEMEIIVAHGERNGRLGDELLHYSQICTEILEEKTMKLMSTIQPIIFIVIGGMVTVIYMSIFFPMFQMMDAI